MPGTGLPPRAVAQPVDEQGNHPVGAGVVIRPRRRDAQAGYRAEQIERIHAAAHRASCLRVVQQHPESRAEVFLEVGRQGIEGRVA